MTGAYDISPYQVSGLMKDFEVGVDDGKLVLILARVYLRLKSPRHVNKFPTSLI